MSVTVTVSLVELWKPLEAFSQPFGRVTVLPLWGEALSRVSLWGASVHICSLLLIVVHVNVHSPKYLVKIWMQHSYQKDHDSFVYCFFRNSLSVYGNCQYNYNRKDIKRQTFNNNVLHNNFINNQDLSTMQVTTPHITGISLKEKVWRICVHRKSAKLPCTPIL